MIDRELLVLFGVPTMFLVAGLFAYGLAVEPQQVVLG
jgi:hypothetical protein